MELRNVGRTISAAAVFSVRRIVTKRLRLESRGFRCKVALYLNYLPIRFDNETKLNLSNFRHNFGLASCYTTFRNLRCHFYHYSTTAVTSLHRNLFILYLL